MLINGVDMNVRLTRAPEAFYLLGTTDDAKVRIKIMDATLFLTQVEFKPLLLLAHANVLGMKRKVHYPITHTLTLKLSLQMQGPYTSLFIKHSLVRFPKGCLLQLLKTQHLLVLPVQTPASSIITI
jgi:hypothetical protein